MSNRPSRRLFLTTATATASLSALPLWAQAPDASLRPQLRGSDLRKRSVASPQSLLANAGLTGAVTYAIADVKSGKILESAGAQTGMPPASVAKALTAAYALESLGAGHRFQTRLVTRSKIQNGILNGDLILVGGADPTLDTNALAALARDLKAAGLREVRGKFIVYEGALPFVRSIDPGQPDHVGYSPAVSGISLNFNRVHFEWRRASGSWQTTMDARSNKYRPDVRSSRMRISKRSLPIYTYEDANGIDNWTVASAALGSGGARWLPVRNPALYAGDVLRTLARANGITLPAATPSRRLQPGTSTLARHQSAPLRDILRDMLKFSTNLTAEMVGLSATAARGKAPTTLKASAREMSRWAATRYGMTSTQLVDHSGLGDASRMSAQDLVNALVRLRSSNALRPILKPFALRNSKGQVLKNHPIKVDAKTGTLNFVSGLGGYMTTPGGTELAFAIFAADTPRRARIPKANRERPEGASSWNKRAKRLQQSLIERWGGVYGS